jgi:hypothetical protein
MKSLTRYCITLSDDARSFWGDSISASSREGSVIFKELTSIVRNNVLSRVSCIFEEARFFRTCQKCIFNIDFTIVNIIAECY